MPTTPAAKRAAPRKPAVKLPIVAFIGNFEPPHSTENHVARALENNGHTVVRVQENSVPNWAEYAHGTGLLDSNADMVLWTRTGWDWPGLGITEAQAHAMQHRMLRKAGAMKIPTVGYHLDIWHGLAREHLVREEPFFQCELVITADGGHEAEFEADGVNHVWFPPGVSRDEAKIGTPRDDFRSKLAFVGNNDGSYHQEHQHRHELVRWLRQNFRRDCAFYPRPGEHAIRGVALQDLYASVDVVIGDSAFAGTGLNRYWSDRVPETLGRGGFLLHPYVPGLAESFNQCGPMEWEAGNWDELGRLIEHTLTRSNVRHDQAKMGRDEVLKHHTYEYRMSQLVELLQERNML